ncbi:MAG: phasin family protein [Brachymonas sp.]|nr:phasin family protein [Brachymonas sp.]
MMTPEQIAAANKAQLETLFGLTNKAFESMEKIVELNMAAAKAAMNDVAESAQAALDAKDAQELLAVQARLLQPLAEKTAAYSRHLYEITANSTAELGKAVQTQAQDNQRKFAAAVDGLGKNAPAGCEAGVAAMKNMVTAANTAFESMQKAVQQAADMAQRNFKAMVGAAAAASASSTGSGKSGRGSKA